MRETPLKLRGGAGSTTYLSYLSNSCSFARSSKGRMIGDEKRTEHKFCMTKIK